METGLRPSRIHEPPNLDGVHQGSIGTPAGQRDHLLDRVAGHELVRVGNAHGSPDLDPHAHARHPDDVAVENRRIRREVTETLVAQEIRAALGAVAPDDADVAAARVLDRATGERDEAARAVEGRAPVDARLLDRSDDVDRDEPRLGKRDGEIGASVGLGQAGPDPVAGLPEGEAGHGNGGDTGDDDLAFGPDGDTHGLQRFRPDRQREDVAGPDDVVVRVDGPRDRT